MSFINFVRSRYFWICVLIALLLLVALERLTMGWLKDFTHHGESITVPDLQGLTLEEVKDRVTALKLDFVINDSTYLPKKKAGLVLAQDPGPESQVKEGRKIYLTVTRRVPTLVVMPNVVDRNLVKAQKVLESNGLTMGTVTYHPAQGKNLVLEQHYKGSPVVAGRQIPKGSRIDLVVADGIGETKGEVPSLIGGTLGHAKWVLSTLNFNVGYVGWDNTITDSSTAIIYKQVPSADSREELNYGEAIDIYLTQNPPDYIKNQMPDSTDNE